jgi:hypothetical protein
MPARVTLRNDPSVPSQLTVNCPLSTVNCFNIVFMIYLSFATRPPLPLFGGLRRRGRDDADIARKNSSGEKSAAGLSVIILLKQGAKKPHLADVEILTWVWA